LLVVGDEHATVPVDLEPVGLAVVLGDLFAVLPSGETQKIRPAGLPTT